MRASEVVIDASRPSRAALPLRVLRRPLFDGTLRVRAFDLEVSGSEDAHRDPGAFWDELLALAVDGLAPGTPARLFVDRDFVLGADADGFRDDRLDFGIARARPADPAFVLGLRNLRALGHGLILDDWSPDDDRSLLDLVHEVRLDASSEAGIAAIARSVAPLRDRDVRVVATRLPDAETFERCRDLGVDRFSGEVFRRRTPVRGRRLTIEARGKLDLLGLINDPEATIDHFETVVRADASLSWRLLKYVNSSLFSLSTTVTSTRHAVMLLGLGKARAWASLVVLADSGGRRSAVLDTALLRARMCEILAARTGREPVETCFTAGLLSVLDVLLERPLEELVAELPLDDELEAALLARSGPAGEVLDHVAAYESGAALATPLSGARPGDLRDAYLEALAFAARTRGVENA